MYTVRKRSEFGLNTQTPRATAAHLLGGDSVPPVSRIEGRSGLVSLTVEIRDLLLEYKLSESLSSS